MRSRPPAQGVAGACVARPLARKGRSPTASLQGATRPRQGRKDSARLRPTHRGGGAHKGRAGKGNGDGVEREEDLGHSF
ncbi:hypothetical protein BHE74_00041048 [Ensete ventricosum]|nr:hypothetical protein BHE74_00041048 [Ensete ventricosum]